MKPRDELSRILVVPTGPNPDLDIYADLASYVAVEEQCESVTDVHICSTRVVGEILSEFSCNLA
jgi:hypothetical protein